MYKERLEIAREAGTRPGEATSYWALVLLAEERGDLRVAVERPERAAAMMEEMGLGEREKARGEVERLRRRLAGERGGGG